MDQFARLEEFKNEYFWSPTEDGPLQNADFELYKTPLHTDIAKVRAAVEKCLTKDDWQKKYGNSDYLGVGLTCSDPNRPYVDEGEIVKAYDLGGRHDGDPNRSHRRHKTPLFNELEFFWAQLQDVGDFKLIQPRLVNLRPGAVLLDHIDSPCAVTLHLPLTSNAGATMAVNGVYRYLPADGSSYILNARKHHHVVNFGSSDRIHLCVGLRPKDWTAPLAKKTSAPADVGSTPTTEPPIIDVTASQEHFRNDGGRELYRRLRQDIERPTRPRFRLHVGSTAMMDGSFRLTLGLVASLCISFQRVFFLEPEHDLGKIKADEPYTRIIKFLRKVETHATVNELMRKNISAFLNKIV